MTYNEKDALNTYLESQLIAYVEGIERHGVSPVVLNEMYDRAYQLLNDIDITLTVDVELKNRQRKLT